MKRTLISLDDQDERWREEMSARESTTGTELVRRAVKLLRSHTLPRMQPLLQKTRGLWRGEDGLDYQQWIRDEW
jgi:hypothetical protein